MDHISDRGRDVVGSAVKQHTAVTFGFVDHLMDQPRRDHHDISGGETIGLVVDKVAADTVGQIINLIVRMVVDSGRIGGLVVRNLEGKIAVHGETSFLFG
jgi:hypothetical protein